MHNEYKPVGYNSVSPYFIIEGAQKLIDLLKSIFGAKELRRYDQEDGSIMHAEIQIDDSVIMMGDASDQFPPNQLLIHIYVRDVDETFTKAISLGCVEVEKPKQQSNDPDRRGSFKDFGGNIWSIATQLPQQ
jgi:uncharacterized glyoxalase superfamily protein PhnB